MSEETDTRKIVWQADEQDAAKAEALREALREVIDPEIGLNIIELGLIRDVNLEPEKTAIKMILTTPFCPRPANETRDGNPRPRRLRAPARARRRPGSDAACRATLGTDPVRGPVRPPANVDTGRANGT